MGDDNDPPKNPFIRWKQHVDFHIGTTLNGLLGIPSMVTKNLNIRNESDDKSDAAATPIPTASSTANASPAAAAPPSSPSSPSSSQQTPQAGSDNYHSTYPSASSASSASQKSPSDGDELDGVDANQLLEWHKFIYYSPYSPLKLQQQQHLHLLPPPVPQDVPFGADPYAFTYADAFEDLLRANSGHSLLDLADRSYRNLRYQMRYGSAVEPPYVFFHRMHSQGLLDAFFPRLPTAGIVGDINSTNDTRGDSVVRAVAALAERDHDLWAQRQEEEADKNYDASNKQDDHDDRDDFDEYDEDDNDAAYESWSHQEAGNASISHNRSDRPAGYGGGGLFDELDRVFRVLGRIIDEDTDNTTSDREKNTDSAKQPNAEDELYDAVRSAYSNAEKSLTTLIKSFSGGFEPQGRFDRTPSTEVAVRTDEQRKEGSGNGSQGDTIQTTDEHVDVFGNRHVKTVVRRLDADGNEVSRETRYTIRSPTAQEASIKEADDITDERLDKAATTETTGASKPYKTEDNTKPSGWFWK